MTLSNSLKIHLAALIVLCAFLSGCETTRKPLAEAPPVPTVSPFGKLPQMSKLPPPELYAVQEAVKRVFKDSIAIDISHKPTFIAGDFNGDRSEDLAVVLKPAPEKLSDLNTEMPTWMLRDPFDANEPRVPRLRVAATDPLLGVIHGYGPNGWRDPEATQAYLLKNVVGSGMAVRQPEEVTTANKGKKLPQFTGEVLSEVLGGTAGYLYYSTATYSWYDPKSFKGDPEPGAFHGMSKGKKRE